jgi:glycosyltransferase involved in cell wall biosynthesis
MAALGTFLGRLLGKRTAVTLHGLGTLDSSVDGSILWKFYRAISLKLADTVIATSEEMKSVALRFTSAENIVVIPNGVDSRRFSPTSKPTSPEGEVVILSIRRLAPKNGVQYLVEAAPEVLAAAQGCLLGNRRANWKATSGVVFPSWPEKHFRFLGMVPHDQTPMFTARQTLSSSFQRRIDQPGLPGGHVHGKSRHRQQLERL